MKMRITKFLPLAAMAFVITSCVQRTDYYHVTFETENGTWKADEKAYQNEDYTATFVPNDGYTLDEKHIRIEVNDKRIAGGYTFHDNELKINKDMIMGDMLIQATPKLISYRVFPNVKYAEVTFPDKPYYHTEFVANLKVSEEYSLPNSLKVYIGNNELSDGFTYDRAKGKLTIEPNKVEDDITITGESTALKPVIFKGHGGKWEGEDQIKVYVPDGATFGDARAKASGLEAPILKKFRRWVYDGTDTTVSDSTIISQSGAELVVDARYDDDTTYMVRIDDGHGHYFPENYFRKPIHANEPLDFINFDLKIDDKDIGSNYLPEDKSQITVKMAPRLADTITLDCVYTPYKRDSNNRVIEANILVKQRDDDPARRNICGDVTISFNSSSYSTLDVTFDPGAEGQWVEGDNKPRTVALPNDRRYTIFEAALKANEMSMPFAKNSNLAFVGWYTDNPSETINENKYISSSITYHAKYATVSFENDSWENVINAAEQGLSYLYERYNIGSDDNILGCQRSVMIGDDTQGYVNIKTRVIGVNHDVIAGNVKTALTFEFQDTFYLLPFSNSSYEFYDTAYIHKLLNDSSKGLLGKIPDILNKHIQSVNKPTCKGDERIDNIYDKFFLLSANEIGLREGDLPGGESVKGDEGSTYAFYKDAHVAKDILKKGTQIVDNPTYWLRSSKDRQYAYAIDGSGLCNAIKNTDTCGVAPAFSIGVADYNYAANGVFDFASGHCVMQRSSFLVGQGTPGQFNNIQVKAESGYLFDDSDCVVATNCSVTQKMISDDKSTLVCSIAYNATQAASNNIKVTFNATITGKTVEFKLLNCTSNKTGFAIYGDPTGTITGLEFKAAEGYIFPQTPIPTDIFVYNSNLYTINILNITLDGKTLLCEIVYHISGPEFIDSDIEVIAQEGKVNSVKLTTENCSSDFTSKLIVDSHDKIEFDVVADADCVFDPTDDYKKNCIVVEYNNRMSVNYEVKKKTDNSLTVTLYYGVLSAAPDDITITARAFKPGICTITGNNCTVDTTSYSYRCGQDVSFKVTATIKGNDYTFLDLFDSEILKVTTRTLRGDINVSSIEIKNEGKTVDLTITINNIASRCNEIELSINPRSTAIPE